MTSKEALEELRCVLVSNQGTKKYSDIFEENLLRPIEKDLEILEIIKKWSFIQEDYKERYGPYTKFQCIIHTIGMKEDFEKVKEWLEN